MGAGIGFRGALSTAGQSQENLWVHHNACWHSHHATLEPGMPQQSWTGLGWGFPLMPKLFDGSIKPPRHAWGSVRHAQE